LAVCETTDEVVGALALARQYGVPWLLLGGGCNVLVSDLGVRGLVIVNRAARIQFDGPLARAEAGALLALLARETVERGLAGLEWAAGLPGTVGGAVVGNAGAFDGDVASVLQGATVLGPDGETVECPNEWFEFDYRSSLIKRGARNTEHETRNTEHETRNTKHETRNTKHETRSRRQEAGGEGYIVLAATFGLRPGDPQALAARVDEILEWRRTRHPAGATMGSTFKNPPGSHAGYLIEQAGLRGYRIGGAQISELHGNFFLNTGTATAADVLALVEYARSEVQRQFGVELELEIELVGEGWGNGT